jgi:hypothetical protein
MVSLLRCRVYFAGIPATGMPSIFTCKCSGSAGMRQFLLSRVIGPGCGCNELEQDVKNKPYKHSFIVIVYFMGNLSFYLFVSTYSRVNPEWHENKMIFAPFRIGPTHDPESSGGTSIPMSFKRWSCSTVSGS